MCVPDFQWVQLRGEEVNVGLGFCCSGVGVPTTFLSVVGTFHAEAFGQSCVGKGDCLFSRIRDEVDIRLATVVTACFFRRHFAVTVVRGLISARGWYQAGVGSDLRSSLVQSSVFKNMDQDQDWLLMLSNPINWTKTK